MIVTKVAWALRITLPSLSPKSLARGKQRSPSGYSYLRTQRICLTRARDNGDIRTARSRRSWLGPLVKFKVTEPEAIRATVSKGGCRL